MTTELDIDTLLAIGKEISLEIYPYRCLIGGIVLISAAHGAGMNW